MEKFIEIINPILFHTFNDKPFVSTHYAVCLDVKTNIKIKIGKDNIHSDG